VLSSVGSLLVVLFAFRFEGFSRKIFIIDAVLIFLFLAASRLTFRLFRQFLPFVPSRTDRRVLIYGAGNGGELLLRELLNNRQLQLFPIGFLDDDPAKVGRLIHGLKVFDGKGDLGSVCNEQQVDEVVISSLKMSDESVEAVLRYCSERNIVVKRMHITMGNL
jgi:UDP-GlcNAc:undecaprenyl-phosphate/decaprenyl-phosphate GlcNAc-1-phosphate transferase